MLALSVPSRQHCFRLSSPIQSGNIPRDGSTAGEEAKNLTLWNLVPLRFDRAKAEVEAEAEAEVEAEARWTLQILVEAKV